MSDDDFESEYSEGDYDEDDYYENDDDTNYGPGCDTEDDDYCPGSYTKDESYEALDMGIGYINWASQESSGYNARGGEGQQWSSSTKKSSGYNARGVATRESSGYNARGGEVQQWSSSAKKSIVDKQSGSYAKTAVTHSYSSGGVLKEPSSGRVGYKDEIKTTKTCKVGDKRGYTEYQVEERYRKVAYDESSGRSSSYSLQGKKHRGLN